MKDLGLLDRGAVPQTSSRCYKQSPKPDSMSFTTACRTTSKHYDIYVVPRSVATIPRILMMTMVVISVRKMRIVLAITMTMRRVRWRTAMIMIKMTIPSIARMRIIRMIVRALLRFLKMLRTIRHQVVLTVKNDHYCHDNHHNHGHYCCHEMLVIKKPFWKDVPPKLWIRVGIQCQLGQPMPWLRQKGRRPRPSLLCFAVELSPKPPKVLT